MSHSNIINEPVATFKWRDLFTHPSYTKWLNGKNYVLMTNAKTLEKHKMYFNLETPRHFLLLGYASFLIGFILSFLVQCCFSKKRSLIRQIKFLLNFLTITQKHEHLCTGIQGKLIKFRIKVLSIYAIWLMNIKMLKRLQDSFQL